MTARRPSRCLPSTPETGYGYAIVPFTVTIPANAEPGDHVGGFIASLVSVGSAARTAPNIQLDQRVAARVYIRVPGELKPGLELSDVVATWQPGSHFASGSMSVEYTLRNTGNVRMAVEPRVGVAGPFGLLCRGRRFTSRRAAPGGRDASDHGGRGRRPLIRETVTVEATAVAATGGEEPGIGTVSTEVHVWAAPWVILGILLALLTLLVLRVLRGRRRRARSRARRSGGGRRSQRVVGQTDAPEPVVPGNPTPGTLTSV